MSSDSFDVDNPRGWTTQTFHGKNFKYNILEEWMNQDQVGKWQLSNLSSNNFVDMDGAVLRSDLQC